MSILHARSIPSSRPRPRFPTLAAVSWGKATVTIAAAVTTVALVASPASAGIQAPAQPRTVTAIQTDPWGTKVSMTANCVNLSIQHNVTFGILADSTPYVRRFAVVLRHHNETQWEWINGLSVWTDPQAGSFGEVFGWAPEPNEQMWHQYLIAYQVQLADGTWSDIYVQTAYHEQDGSPSGDGCATG